ncbi:DUF1028 domain-containing protein [Flagellimonas sp. DF-77]|uniref:DUF1028 domain-containing protein n=1 Tax=Flagellimonas algarum TaxID=3230298 RepID=UPI003397D6D2
MNFRTIAEKLFLLMGVPVLFAQNLPSLIHDKDLNTTFAIVAYDAEQEEYGVAVATNNIYVGSSTVYIEPGLGAFAVIAETEPRYAKMGFEQLAQGAQIENAVSAYRSKDPQAHLRQVAGLDAQGNTYAFTGSGLRFWKGMASFIEGPGFVVLGNQLAPRVLERMADAFTNGSGALAQRLMTALLAGQEAGGQLTGKRSAALQVKGEHHEWYNQIDLRVDNAEAPIQDLQRLLGYHYGRIRVNQALYAQRSGNEERAKRKLAEAEILLEGWDGMYARLARAHLALGHPENAVAWIQRGLEENPAWTEYLPSFYLLREHPSLRTLIKPDTFTPKDWEAAFQFLSLFGRENEIIAKGEQLLSEPAMDTSNMNFIVGRSYYYEKENEKAVAFLEKALSLDEGHSEAIRLLQKIKSK